MLELRCLQVGVLSVNCYILSNPSNQQAYVIDPGDQVKKIQQELESASLIPQAILLTHAHVDHIRAVAALSAAYQLPVWLHPDDLPLYLSPENAILPWIPAAENLPKPQSEFPLIAGIDIQVIHTPGHTKGGVCYYIENEKILLTGDTIFQGSVGRTDFPGGDSEQLWHSILEKILPLPEEVKIYPGHQEASTIAAERLNYR